MRWQIAQAKASGKDTSSLESKVAEEQTKLSKNIQLDQAAAGQASKGVTGGSSGTNEAAAKASSTAKASATSSAASSTATAAASGSDASSFSFAVQE